MRRFTILLILALVPLTLAPRTATEPAPASGQLTSAIIVRDGGAAGGVVPVQVRVANGTAGDLRTAKVRISSTATAGLSLVASSHGCTPASATALWPLTCTVNLPAGKLRVVNVVLRAPSTGVGTVTAPVSQS